MWRGQVVDDTTLLVKYTWGGDADLDGDLDGDDYFWIDTNAASSGSVFGFANGDFDYDGDIDGDDYFIIDSNIIAAQGGSPFENSTSQRGMSTVPEPASAASLFAAFMPLLRRRRRAGS
jgi:hypothetical protein